VVRTSQFAATLLGVGPVLYESTSGGDGLASDVDARRSESFTPTTAVYSLKEAAVLFGISRTTAYRRARADDLPVPVFKVGGQWVVSRRAVNTLLNLS
jgi:predicted DNA-binding transcriptional regulator AlpA